MTGPVTSGAPDVEEIGRRLDALRCRIAAAGGGERPLRLVAVTKGFGTAAVAGALANGIVDIGENYAQELVTKAGELEAVAAGSARTIRWHHLGAVQRRQVRRLAPLVSLWHGVTRVEEASAIAAVCPGAEVLVQVESTGLPGRRGIAAHQVAALVDAARSQGVEPVGVMTIGVPGDRDRTQRAFRIAAAAGRDLGLPECSMGMSDDVELAVAEGATLVRVGRALFGDRPPTFHPHGPLSL